MSSYSRGGGGGGRGTESPRASDLIAQLPQRIMEQFVSDLQAHLEEMERMQSRMQGGGGGGSRRPAPPDDGQRYQYAVDLPGFGPEELSVQSDGRRVMVRARRERRNENPDGSVCRLFCELRRELTLPEDADHQGLTCHFQPDDGQLRLEAPSRAQGGGADDRGVPIPITRVQPPRN